MHRESVFTALHETDAPGFADARAARDGGEAIEVESALESLVMIALMCLTGLLFSACFDLVTVA